MALFEAKAAAVASALTPLILVASFHSALSQENSVTAPARLAAQAGILGFLLVHSDIAYADGDQSIEGAAPRPVRTASQSKNKLAKGGGPMHLYRSSEGRSNRRQRSLHNAKKAFRSRARLSRRVREGLSIKDQQSTCASFTKISGQ